MWPNRLLAGLFLLWLVLSSSLAALARTPQPERVKGFVTRSGSQLVLHGRAFRFSGPNIVGLGLLEHAGGVRYPSRYHVEDALATAKEMGATVVRSHAALSVGCELCIQPAPGIFNERALRVLDYAVAAAGRHGLRLVLPLVDNYHYYFGGKHTFTTWRGIVNEEQFYMDPRVIGDFKLYVSTILNRDNTITGVAYKDDPAILAWETGNELKAPIEWTEMIANYIKSIDSRHLVASGEGGADREALPLPNVDLYTAHFYPMNATRLVEFAQATRAARKVFFVGEYNWNNHQDGTPLSEFLETIEREQVAGDLYWHLLPHDDHRGYVQHSEEYELHYPGDTDDMRARAQALRTHAYTMQGVPVPKPAIPGAPLITIGVTEIAWRGSAGASSYSIERSDSSAKGPWKIICNQCATDNDTPWRDPSTPGGTVWYRVRAHNLAGVAGSYSPVVRRHACRPHHAADCESGLRAEPAVISFTLIDADSARPIAGYDPIVDGAVINLAKLPTRNLNVRANTQPARVGSVRFKLDQGTITRIENSEPYALAGDTEEGYHGWRPSVGRHTLTATPFTGTAATGTKGKPLVIAFQVVDQR